MKELMKKTVLPAAACAALAVLAGCGGQPERYEDGSAVSVFVWNEDAWAEHPGVAAEGDPGTPISSRRRLVGKQMTLTFNAAGGAGQQEIIIRFDTQSHCRVETKLFGVVNGFMTSNASNNSYEYTLVGDAGTAAKLTVTYIDAEGDMGNINVDLVFNSALRAAATIQEVRTGGNLLFPGTNRVVPGTAGNVEWVVY